MTVDSMIETVLNIIATVLLGIITIAGLGSYLYIDLCRLYKKRERRKWIGLLAIILPLIALTSGIGILMIWNILARRLFWQLLLLAGVVSFILWQSITSPYKIADWWSKLGNWLKK